MKKRSIQALKAGARKSLKIPPGRVEKPAKLYKRNPKHRSAYREEGAPEFF